MGRLVKKIKLLSLFFRRNFFKRIIIYYMVTLVVLFFLFSVIITFMINNSYKKELLQLNETSLEQSNKISENIYGNIFLFGSDLYRNDQNLLYLLYAETYTDLCSIKFHTLSNKLSSYNNLIHSYEIINLKADFVCSNFSTFTDTASFSDQDIITYLKNSKPSLSPVLLMPRTISAAGGSSDKSLKSNPVLSIIFYDNTAGAFVINIDQATALTIFDSATTSNLVENIIINQNGLILTSSDNFSFASSIKNQTIYQEIMTSPKAKGTFTESIGGQSYYVSYYRSSAMGLVFVKLMKNILLDTNNSLLVRAVYYSVVFILTSLLVCFLLSFRLYRPIKNLTSNLSHYTINPPGFGDEFAEITKTCHNMYQENKSLHNKITRYKNVGRARAIKQLLDSSFASITPIKNNLEDFDLVLDGPNYLVLLIGIDPPGEDNYIYPDDSSLLLYSIYNIITELMSPYLRLECVDLNSSQLVCIINMDNTLDLQYYEDLEKAQEAMQAYFQVTFSCGIGNIVTDLEGIKESYHKADIAYNHRLVTGYNKIISYDSLNFVKESEQLYPYVLEKNILNAIKSMQNNLMTSCINDFFNSIKSYYYDQIILYTLQLGFSFKQFVSQYELEENNLYKINEYALQNNQTLDQMALHFIHCGDSLIQSLIEIRAHKSDKSAVIQDVIALVEKNIYNPNLTVEMIAEDVNLSVNYLRNIFKENTDKSLSGFITEKKLELTCSLLIESEMTIQEISETVGFTTKNYFFTFFKKHIGITPNQYRKEHKKESLHQT